MCNSIIKIYKAIKAINIYQDVSLFSLSFEKYQNHGLFFYNSIYKRSRLHLFRKIILLMQRVMKIDLLSLKVGDSSHISPENDVLCSIINEEKKKESFTVVEIGGISSSHVTYLRQHLSSWTRQLA